VAIEAVESQEPERPRAKRRRRRGGRRRRRDHAPSFGAMLPNLLTTGNLAAGFYAIVKASTGDPVFASYLIFVAGIFDILDGRAARLAGVESEFGQQYDSISDTVSFGVAPAVIAFHAGGFQDLRWAGWLLAFIYTTCASLRLARFNVSSGRYKGRFDGLPSPAAAGMVVSTVWFTGWLRGLGVDVDVPPIFGAVGVAMVGFAMVTPIPYHNMKGIKLGSSFGGIAFAIVLAIFVALEPGLNFFLIGLAYILSGPFELIWRKRTGRSLEDLAVAVQEAAQEVAQDVGLHVPPERQPGGRPVPSADQGSASQAGKDPGRTGGGQPDER
jgi:CDP-diacylglycerol--serine O-phosphatidyltransferase